MARAHRYYLPGHIYHLTHRCHKREFLLKFSKDRKRWLELLFEARKRFGLIILNYTVTSNHIHLLAFDDAGQDVIPRSMQLIAGRTGQARSIIAGNTEMELSGKTDTMLRQWRRSIT